MEERWQNQQALMRLEFGGERALAEAASWYAASGGYRTAAPAVMAPPALWWLDTIYQSDFVPGFFVDISDHLELKQRMLACHQSQMRRGDQAFASLDAMMVHHC